MPSNLTWVAHEAGGTSENAITVISANVLILTIIFLFSIFSYFTSYCFLSHYHLIQRNDKRSVRFESSYMTLSLLSYFALRRRSCSKSRHLCCRPAIPGLHNSPLPDWVHGSVLRWRLTVPHVGFLPTGYCNFCSTYVLFHSLITPPSDIRLIIVKNFAITSLFIFF